MQAQLTLYSIRDFFLRSIQLSNVVSFVRLPLRIPLGNYEDEMRGLATYCATWRDLLRTKPGRKTWKGHIKKAFPIFIFSYLFAKLLSYILNNVDKGRIIAQNDFSNYTQVDH